MRTSSLAIALLAAACGSSSPPPASPTPAEPPAGDRVAAPAARGTSGFPGLDWGAPTETVDAAYPGGLKEGDTVAVGSEYEGLPATFTFHFTAGALDSVAVAFTERYAAMEACSQEWTTLRATVDGAFGESKSDNLAAYWSTPTAAIVLACNPGEPDGAELSMHFGPP